MKSRLLFRDDGHVISTRKPRAWPMVLFFITSLVALLGFVEHLDRRDESLFQEAVTQREAERRASYEAGVRQGHAEMVRSAELAWQAAHTEAERCRSR